jgi:hypothetical protein
MRIILPSGKSSMFLTAMSQWLVKYISGFTQAPILDLFKASPASEIFRSHLLYGVPAYLRHITLQKASFSQSCQQDDFLYLLLLLSSRNFQSCARSLPSLPTISSLKTSDFSRYSSVLVLPDSGLAASFPSNLQQS